MQFGIARKEYNLENPIVRCGNSSVANLWSDRNARRAKNLRLTVALKSTMDGSESAEIKRRSRNLHDTFDLNSECQCAGIRWPLGKTQMNGTWALHFSLASLGIKI